MSALEVNGKDASGAEVILAAKFDKEPPKKTDVQPK